jgi:SAM-dependent methyltransferase
LNNYKKYFLYLKKRSVVGLLYRYIFIYPKFIKFLKIRNIDYGCGIGDFITFCKFFNINIKGYDPNPYVQNFIIEKLGDDVLVSKKNLSLKRSVSSYDTVILDNVLEHAKSPKQLIKDTYNLLKKNGYLIVGFPIGVAGYNADPDHKFYLEEKKLIDFICSFGFVINNVFYTPFHSKYLEKNLSAYCAYMVFKKNK